MAPGRNNAWRGLAVFSLSTRIMGVRQREFVPVYIKTGIVLLGATLPFTLVVWAGPVAVLQATIVSVTTFLVIYFVGKRIGPNAPAPA